LKTSIKYKFRFSAIAILMLFSLFSINNLKAASIWQGAFSGSWNNPSNWFPARVPGPTDDVIIQLFFHRNAPVIDIKVAQVKSLEISISGQLTALPGTSLVVLGNTDIEGSFITGGIDATFKQNLRGNGSLDAGTSTIYLGGHMTLINFYARTSTVILNGSAEQDLVKYTFYNLMVNNSGSGVYLLNGIIVKNNLSMLWGNIDLDGEVLTLGTSATSPGVLLRGKSYFTGTGSFKRWFGNAPVLPGSMAGLFPMGTAKYSRCLSISTMPMHGGTISVSHTSNNGNYYFNPSFTDKNGSLIVNTRNSTRWSVVTGNSFSGNSDIMLQGDGLPGMPDNKLLTMSLSNSSAPGLFTPPAGAISGPGTGRMGISAADLNNEFYLAYYSTISPPTTLQAKSSDDHNNTNLSWNSASGVDFMRYDVERSADGFNWVSIGSIDAKTNIQPMEGNIANDSVNYTYQDNTEGSGGSVNYRVKLVKADGYYEYSEVKNVIIPLSLLAFPNPVTDLLHLKWVSTENDNGTMKITDMSGKVLYEQNFQGRGIMDIQIDILNYKTGSYIVSLVSGNQTVSKIISKK
jgi:hypothetical protein